MSDLSAIEKRKLEKALAMGDGYVLNFSNTTFAEYFLDVVGIDIYDDKYHRGSGSKANRMRAFWEKEGNYLVWKVLDPIFSNWDDFVVYGLERPSPECLRIIERLRNSSPVSDLAALAAPADADESFDAVARHVREAIERNEPEAALDRLHTFLVKYIRALCSRHGITTPRDKPLHSLMGEYVKALRTEGTIESEITERILKSTISVMEALNHVRNEHSLAHDNRMLNHEESLLIFSHVASMVRFIEGVENGDATGQEDSQRADDIPF